MPSVSRQPVALCLLCLLALPTLTSRADLAQADRPMSWLADDRSTMALAIRRAARLPGMKQTATDMTSDQLGAIYLDMHSSYGIEDEASFRVRAFEVLDSAVSAERRLDEAWRSADNGNGRYRAAYFLLKYRLRFAEALAKAEISRRMAESGSSSYCSQAMESAIDCLKVSVGAREQFDKLRSVQGYGSVTDLSTGTIREFRERLLSVWHSSKSEGSLAPIRDVDIRVMLNEAVTQTVKDVKARRRVTSLFGWLERSRDGNHSDALSVE